MNTYGNSITQVIARYPYRLLRGCLAVTMLCTTAGSAQLSTRYTVGGRDIVRMDFASTPLGDFPSSLEMVDGIMEVVSKNGQNMLRASSGSVFRVQLPQLLPQDFTLEFDIVPKLDGAPEDLAIEGTPLINQGANSANVKWHRDYLHIVGGGATYDSPVPPSFAATLPGMPTHVVVAMKGETLKLYTNGRLMYTQSNRKFVRSRVLRVFLGGRDDGPNAVHLASFRVVDGVPPMVPIAGGGGLGGSNPSGGAAVAAGVSQGGGSLATWFSGVGQLLLTPSGSASKAGPSSFTAAPQGLSTGLTWSEVPGAASYRVHKKETGAAWPGIYQYMIDFPPSTNSRSAIDPYVIPGVEMTYQVQAVFADGSYSLPSPIAKATPAPIPVGMPGPPNLKVVVGGTLDITSHFLPGATWRYAPGTMGSFVTWSWDPTPGHYGYGVALDVTTPNLKPQFLRRFYFTQPVSPSDPSPISPGPYSEAVPQGSSVLFCVTFWPTNDSRVISGGLNPSQAGMSCVYSQVP
jgi:hypothetical protein